MEKEYSIGGKTYVVLPPEDMTLLQIEYVDKLQAKLFDAPSGEIVYKGETLYEFLECLLSPKDVKWNKAQIGKLREELEDLTVKEASEIVGNFYLSAEGLLNSFQRFLQIKDIIHTAREKTDDNTQESPSLTPSAEETG